MNCSKMQLLAGIFIIATFGATATTYAQAGGAAYEYTIVRGDTLGKLAKQFLGDGKLYVQILATNAVEDVNSIEPGAVLVIEIPADRLDDPAVKKAIASGILAVAKPPAAVAASSRNGRVLRQGKTDDEPLAAGDEVNQQDTVITGDEGFVTLKLENGSRIVVRPESRIKVENLTYRKASGYVDYLFNFVKGKARVIVSKLKPKSKFDVKVAGAIAGVRGTEFRVKVVGDDTSQLEVIESNVALESSGASVDVPENYGTKAERGEPPAKPRPLPDAPAKLSQSADSDDEIFIFSWTEIETADDYDWTMYYDEDQSEVVLTITTGDAEVEIDWEDLPKGTYYWNVSTIDEEGYQSKPSKSKKVVIGEN